MNILIFSPCPTPPATAGNRKRIYVLAHYLRQLGHKLHFCFYTQESVTPKGVRAMNRFWDSVSVIKKTKIPENKDDTFYTIDDWYQGSISVVVRKLCAAFDIDTVIANYIFQSKLLEYVPDHIYKVLDTHDRFSNRKELLLEGKADKLWYHTTVDEEVIGLNRADLVWAIQENEATFFRSQCKSKVECIPHLEVPRFRKNMPQKLQKMCFMGSHNSVNIAALESFLPVMLSKIDLLNLDAEIHIAGKVCKAITIEHPQLFLHGFVDDEEQFYHQMDVAINPLEVGTGLKIKTVDALCYGIPIVSTAVGTEGLPVVSPFHTASDIYELSRRIVELIRDRDLLRPLQFESRKIFKEYNANTKRCIDDSLLLDPIRIAAAKQEKAGATNPEDRIAALEERLVKSQKRAFYFKTRLQFAQKYNQQLLAKLNEPDVAN